MADFLGMMKQAAQLQSKMKAMQDELEHVEVEGISGGGLVSVRMSGRHEVRAVSIDRKLFADDPEMAEDLVAAAFNDAVNKVAALSQQKLGNLASGMNLPAGFKLPF